ncbi:MAG: cyanophycinase [Bacteroidetes bacterium]|nr:cyanophycinase [Bacteroidota bacterium]
MTPKGILVSIGGAEDKGTDLELGIFTRNILNFMEMGILKNIVNLLKDKTARIEVITTASQIPDEVYPNYEEAFTKLGFNNIGHFRIRNREDVMDIALIERLKKCDALMFSGGNQLRLTSIFGGTEFLDIVHERYINDYFIIAGTSAGAMAMSNTMIYEGNATNAHLKGEVKITTGLALLQGVIIDSHLNKRGRFPRLAQAAAANPGAIGIGLVKTGVIVHNGEVLEAIGSGAIFIVDGRKIGYNNIGDAEFDEPISVENMVVHIMSKGNTFNLKTRQFSAGKAIVAQ